MLHSNLKKAANRGFIEFQVLRLAKKCVIIHFCFVSYVPQAFFRVVLVLLQNIFLEEVTLKYTTILRIFGTFLDTLREQVLGWSI